MTREECIELALQGSKAVEENEEATNIYVDIAEHLLGSGHASTITEIDIILKGMSVESAENMLSILDGEDLFEGHKEVAGGEPDAEGYMALRQLATAENAIARIRAYIDNQGTMQLPAWVQAKLTTASDGMDTVADYLVTDTDAMDTE